MEEKRKLSTGVIILMLILIVALTSVTTILIYKEINSRNNDKNNPTQNNETLQTDVKNNIDNSEQLNQNENKEENEKNTNLENMKFKIDETIKLNEKECTISVNCDEKIKTITTESDPVITLYRYKYNYNIKINETEIVLTTEGLQSRNMDIFTITDVKNEKEYIVLKIETFGEFGTKTIYYYIYDENANEIGNIVNYVDCSWIIDKNDKEYTGNRFYPNEFSDKIEIYKYKSVEHSENTEYETVMKKIEYTIENGKMVEKIVKTYTSDEFEIAGKS